MKTKDYHFFFFANAPIKIKWSAKQALETLKMFELTWSPRKQPANSPITKKKKKKNNNLKILCTRLGMTSLRCSQPSPTINIVRLRISVQKLVLVSCRVPRTYVRVSDRRVSCGYLMRLSIGLTLTCARRLSAATCQNSQKGVGKDRSTVNNERAVLASKQSRKSWYSRPNIGENQRD